MQNNTQGTSSRTITVLPDDSVIAACGVSCRFWASSKVTLSKTNGICVINTLLHRSTLARLKTPLYVIPTQPPS
ncbi:hypothetical protein G7K_2099-t1 [Saitoella complicata NRRL Y-17804]|uniref:Uncharacterized protein n=1 Tax=Saitoella complicata (strain BCRC 22490 / CBS 7301 / JCM 7358 / NBRC 10748 / NRRL Y-17804) TaxID=698492 RepID=A0A0E9NDN0_SAICN|nr:hypothetical protein G7K_2099-t1 [Saitoella complicata NRRL Y-17804]